MRAAILDEAIMGRLGGLAVVVALSALPAGLSAQETGDPQRGLAFARQVCASCHAVEHGQAYSPNPLSPTFDRIAATPGMTAMALHVFLMTPHRAMPDLVLEPDDMRNVIAHILSLEEPQ